MTQKQTRRTFLKRSFSITVGSLLATSLGYYYARYIEPKQLSIVHQNISHQLIPKNFEGLKIVQFSDLHIGYNYNLKQLQNAVNKINEEKPDIVLFTGDLIDSPMTFKDADKIPPILESIQAPLGKYSIYGNHDHGGYGSNLYLEIMNKAKFTLLVNESTVISLPDGNQICLVGVDDLLLGHPDYDKALENVPQELFTILLAHEPDAAHLTSKYPIHLQLSGHSHGGQVQLPFFGPLITPPLATTYVEGFYEVEESNLSIYVNRGIGTTRLPFRFLSKPEITVFHLNA
ncbi:metallophosphoesterase [Cytobacillus sp. IB215665]|uniref:metallophosphoesterase n=1 Tax=Cytobacillus sp. IB215665 TaxID=3097357 RepID=UPI002A165F94|nr:metallophosphoesterase [Cytobacillus sp. IB215665]MDX8364871.1 metallophosphoesterase [Cytobacillus sp. IB215665]